MRLALIAIIAGLTIGCAEKELPAGKKHGWHHDVGAGVPHRCTILNDGTEILTIGQYDHGEWVTLIRYKGKEEFTVVPRKDEHEVRSQTDAQRIPTL